MADFLDQTNIDSLFGDVTGVGHSDADDKPHECFVGYYIQIHEWKDGRLERSKGPYTQDLAYVTRFGKFLRSWGLYPKLKLMKLVDIYAPKSEVERLRKEGLPTVEHKHIEVLDFNAKEL